MNIKHSLDAEGEKVGVCTEFLTSVVKSVRVMDVVSEISVMNVDERSTTVRRTEKEINKINVKCLYGLSTCTCTCTFRQHILIVKLKDFSSN